MDNACKQAVGEAIHRELNTFGCILILIILIIMIIFGVLVAALVQFPEPRRRRRKHKARKEGPTPSKKAWKTTTWPSSSS